MSQFTNINSFSRTEKYLEQAGRRKECPKIVFTRFKWLFINDFKEHCDNRIILFIALVYICCKPILC